MKCVHFGNVNIGCVLEKWDRQDAHSKLMESVKMYKQTFQHKKVSENLLKEIRVSVDSIPIVENIWH